MQEQFFNGIRFTRTYDSAYFRNMNVTPHGMHRYVWQFYNGPIPKGYEIHHKDGNKANNDISNLECLRVHEHRKLHGRILTEEEREWKRENMRTKAIPKAAEWHGSPEGREWHSQHAQNMTKYEVECVCQECGKKFVTWNNHKQPKKFCSGACKQRHLRRHTPKDVQRVCVICGKEFLTDRYSATQTCSKSCAAALIWRKRKGN